MRQIERLANLQVNLIKSTVHQMKKLNHYFFPTQITKKCFIRSTKNLLNLRWQKAINKSKFKFQIACKEIDFNITFFPGLDTRNVQSTSIYYRLDIPMLILIKHSLANIEKWGKIPTSKQRHHDDRLNFTRRKVVNIIL